MHLRFGRDEAGLSAGHYLLAMMRGGTRWVATTTGRRTQQKVVGLLSQSDLNALHGENPVPIVERIRSAESVAELKRWNERARSLIIEGLTDRSDVRWYAEIATEFNRAVLGRCVELAERELATSGYQPPTVRSCWLFFGSAARRELLTTADLDFGLVHENPQESDRQAVEDYFEKLCLWVLGAVESAGFTFAKSAIRPHDPRWRQSLAGWTSTYAGWIEDPIHNRIYEGRPFFDLTPAYGHLDVAERLQENLGLMLKKNPEFVPLLAVDSFGNLPPLTFFQGLVVDDSGARSDSLDLRRSAIYPLVDVARVFGLAQGSINSTSTVERLAAAKANYPAQSTLLDEAADAMQVALYHRAHSGLRNNSDGAIVATESLSRLDQQLLKNAFRTVLQLMRFGAEAFNIRPRA
jgi:CBS domain-containing protein